MNAEMGPRQTGLTGEAQNSYPGSMDPNRAAETGGNVAVAEAPQGTQAIYSAWERHMQNEGNTVDAAMRQSLRVLAENNVMPPGFNPDRARNQGSSGRGPRQDNRNRDDENREPLAKGNRGEDLRPFLEEFKSVFGNPVIAQELIKSNPNLSFTDQDPPERIEAIKKLREFINGIDPGSNALTFFAKLVASPENDEYAQLRRRQEVELSQQSKKILFEWALENIIGLPEKGSHESSYDEAIRDLNIQSNLTTFRSMAFNDFDQDFAKYIGDLISFRGTAHEFRRALTQGDNYREFIPKGLKTHGLDFLNNKIAGVTEAISLFETFASLKTAQKREWFDTGDIDDIYNNVGKVMRSMQSTGSLMRQDRVLTDWEVERALAIAKTLFAGTQRFAVYSAVGNVPPGAAQRIGSLPYEYIVRTIAQFKVTAVRFFYEGGPREFLKRIRKRLEEGEGLLANDKSLFGIEGDSWEYNGLGAIDIMSHSWRGALMFAGDTRVNIDGREETLLQYITRKALKHDSHFDPALGWEHEEGSKGFADEVESAVLGQKLYLSTLLKHGPWGSMDPESQKRIKTMLWQKVAMLDPMGIASLSPGVLAGLSDQEKAIWHKLTAGEGNQASKMGIASAVRLSLESRNYFDPITGKRLAQNGADLNAETAALKQAINNANDSYKYQIIDKYFGQQFGNSLTAEEIAVIKKVINAGIGAEGAKYLNSVKFPFTFLANDIPHMAWDKTGEGEAGLGDENLFRILLSDQNNLVEGYGKMNGLVENPTHGAVESLAEAVEKIGMVIGREHAQKRIEPFIRAYIDMATEKYGSIYVGGIVNFKNGVPVLNKTNIPLFRKANSEFEKYWRASGLSFDEQDRAEFLDNLARLEAVSSDISKGVAQAQLNKLKRELRADGKWMLWKYLKLLAVILPVTVVLALGITLASKATLEGLEV